MERRCLVLSGTSDSALGDFPDDSNLRRLVFQVDANGMASAGTDVAVRTDEGDTDADGWTFGALPDRIIERWLLRPRPH